ncbi:MAG: hypothetical protein AAF411_00630 [Myxococcota bacterium]
MATAPEPELDSPVVVGNDPIGCGEIRWASEWVEGPDTGLVAFDDPVSGPGFYYTDRVYPAGGPYTHEVRRLAPDTGWTAVASHQTRDHVGRVVTADGTLRFITWGEQRGWLSVHTSFRAPGELLWEAQVTRESVRDVVSAHGGLAFMTQGTPRVDPGVGTLDGAGGAVHSEQPVGVPDPDGIRFRRLIPGHDGQAFVVIGDDSGRAYVGEVGGALARYDRANCELRFDTVQHLRSGELAYVEECGDVGFLNLRSADSASRIELPWVPAAAGEGPGGTLVFGVDDESGFTLVTFDPIRGREIARAPLPSLAHVESSPVSLTTVSADSAGPFVAVGVYSLFTYSTLWTIAELCQP